MASDPVPKSVTEETIVSLTETDNSNDVIPEVVNSCSNGPEDDKKRNTSDKVKADTAAPSEEDSKEMNTSDKVKADTAAPAEGVPRRGLQSQVSVRSELDEVDYDRLSQLSLHMVKDFRYYFQAPYLRLFVAYFVVLCNFLIYAEDPVAHSVAECTIPVIGNAVAFVASRYPPNAWSILKVVLWLAALITGIVLGKLLHVFVLNRLLRLKAFSGDQGSWMVMFFCSILCLFVFSWIYNLFLLAGGESTVPYRVSSLLGISNSTFMKLAACGTWLGDLFTAWMVTDMMLQERLYPNWAKTVRKWWVKGYHRIILFWVVVISCTAIVVLVISTDIIQWDSLNRGFLPTNELSRAFLASFILVMDLFIVMQDWDFPHFLDNFDVKLPGLNVVSIQFDVPRWLKEDWTVHITGKWFNYGILLMVMLLDLNMWKNQIFYSPFDFGQYVGPDNQIHTVTNVSQLAIFNKTYLTYAWRSNNSLDANGTVYAADDYIMNARYLGYSLPVKAIAFLPSIAAFIVFGVLVAMFGRFPVSEGKRYFGRMKKRRLTARRSAWSRRLSRARRTMSAASAPAQACPTITEEGTEVGPGEERDRRGSRRIRMHLKRSTAIDEDGEEDGGGRRGLSYGRRRTERDDRVKNSRTGRKSRSVDETVIT